MSIFVEFWIGHLSNYWTVLGMHNVTLQIMRTTPTLLLNSQKENPTPAISLCAVQ